MDKYSIVVKLQLIIEPLYWPYIFIAFEVIVKNWLHIICLLYTIRQEKYENKKNIVLKTQEYYCGI